jgi:hypothetical protein
MQYSKHNFYHNFITSATADQKMAWEMLANEINELALDQPSKVIEMLNANGIKVSSNTGTTKLATSLLEGVYTNKTVVIDLTKLIKQRHNDPYINAGGGVYEKSDASADEIIKNINTILSGKDVLTKEETKKILLIDLKSKLSQRGVKVGISPIKFIVTVAAISGLCYLGYKLLSTPKQV